MVKDSLSPRTHRATSVTPHMWRPLLSAVVLLATLFYSALSFAQILGTAQLNTERRGHTATLLQNGKILIVGGENQSGIIVSQAEILDPASLTSTPAPAAASPRTDHTATLLSDGRVLISGGRDQMSALDSTQIYDASLNSFSSGPSLKRARSGHSATALADGKILIVGGDATGSGEVYDPATQIFSLVGGNLGIARNLHRAVLLNNGQLLIVGGVNAQNALLNSAEIYDPASHSFHVPSNPLQILRALATLRLLPDGKVQVIGGDSDFSMEIFDAQVGNFNGVAYLPPSPELLVATLSTRSRAALISPTASQNPNLLGTSLTSEQLDLLDRADQTITELPSQNKALVAGGVNSTGQVLNSASLVQSSPASVTTDKTDYAPGTIVTITGRGFQPNEDVALTLHERRDAYADPGFVATADEQGNFIFMQFAPQSIDVGRTFTLTAIGQSSGFSAQTAFTDAGALTLTPNSGEVGTSVTVSSGGGAFDGSANNIGIYWDGTLNTKTGTQVATCAQNNGGNITGTCIFTVPSSTAGLHTVVATQLNNNNFSVSTQFTVVGTPTQLAFTAQPITSTVNNTIGSSPAGGIKVAIQDANGNTNNLSTASITVAIGSNPSGGTLSGTTTVAAVNGVATFSNLSINAVGTGYTLSASSAGLTGTTSSAFNIIKANTTTVVSCTLTNLVVDNTQTCTATVTDAATIKTVPTGTVTWTTSAGGASQFGSTSCTLAQLGPAGNGQASCQVSYTPNATGSRTVSGA